MKNLLTVCIGDSLSLDSSDKEKLKDVAERLRCYLRDQSNIGLFCAHSIVAEQAASIICNVFDISFQKSNSLNSNDSSTLHAVVKKYRERYSTIIILVNGDQSIFPSHFLYNEYGINKLSRRLNIGEFCIADVIGKTLNIF